MAAVKFALVLISPEAIAAASMREPAAPTAASSRRAASRETGSLAGSSPAAAFGSGLVTASAGAGSVKGGRMGESEGEKGGAQARQAVKLISAVDSAAGCYSVACTARRLSSHSPGSARRANTAVASASTKSSLIIWAAQNCIV